MKLLKDVYDLNVLFCKRQQNNFRHSTYNNGFGLNKKQDCQQTVHAVFHFVPPLEIHNLYFGKYNKGDKSYKFMLQVANFHR
jgi:hypothetical protein